MNPKVSISLGHQVFRPEALIKLRPRFPSWRVPNIDIRHKL